MDPFEALGVERRWDLPESAIREAQRRAAAKWHPDRWSDPARRDEAQRRMAQTSEAAARLLDPLERGSALLQATAPASRPNEPRPSAAFLAEMLELHEARASDDAQVRHEAMERLRSIRQAAEVELEACFRRLLGGDQAAWLAAAEALGSLRASVRALEGWSS